MNTKKSFLCFLVAIFIALSTFSATPSSSGVSEDSFYKQVEILFQHIERRLSLKIEEAAIETARQKHRLTEQEIKLQSLEDKFNKFKKEQAEWLKDHQNPIIAIAEKKKEEVRAAGDRYVSLAGEHFSLLSIFATIVVFIPTLFSIFNAISFKKKAKENLIEMSNKLKQMDSLIDKGKKVSIFLIKQKINTKKNFRQIQLSLPKKQQKAV